MRRVTGAERRARLGIRHCHAESTAAVDDAAAAVIGLHASDPATVYLSARARVAGFSDRDGYRRFRTGNNGCAAG